MSNENIIPTVNSNQDKYQLYKTNMSRYNKAIKQDFYLEALWYLYAMLEARTEAFFYHLGFTQKGDRTKVSGSKKKEIRELLGIEDSRGFNKLGCRLDYMETLFNLALSDTEENDPFKSAVKESLRYIHSKEVDGAIKYLKEEFCSKRNQLTHALFNKDPSAAYVELKKIVTNGHSQMRIIDNAINLLKNHAKIRRKFNIQ